ncbi:MOS1T transposase, partial [Pseudoatta argentina]
VVDTRCLRQGYGSFIRATRLDDDDEVSARLRCGMIVCHRHPTRATGNHADGIELSAGATEANAKLEIYPSGNGWFEVGIPVTRFIAQRRTRGVGKQQVVERRETQDKELEQLLDEDPSQTLSELGKILQVDESSVSKRLKGLGMKPRDVERLAMKRGYTTIIQSVENRGVSPAMHPHRLCIWWDQQGVIYYQRELKWEALPHPPYSPDIAPSDFPLFRSMAHGLADRRFHSYEEAQKWIDSWIAPKDMSFFRRGIHVLPERWEKVVSSDGQYLK